MTPSKPWRIIWWIVGILIAVLVVLQIFALFCLGPILADRLETKVSEASSGVYAFDRKNARLNLLSGSLVLTNLSLTPDTVRYRQLKKEGVARPNLYQVNAPQVKIKGAELWDAFKTKELAINTLEVEQPEIRLVNHPSMKKNKADTLKVDNLHELTGGILTSISVEKLEVRKGSFFFNEDRTFSSNAFVAKDISIQVTNFQLDSAAQFSADRSFYVDDIEMRMDVKDYSFVMPDSTYEIKVGNLGISSSKSQITAGDIFVKPRYQEFATYKFEGKTIPTLAEVHIPRLLLEGVNFHEIYFDEKINLGALRLQQPHLRLIGKERNLQQEEVAQKKPPTIHELYSKISAFARSLKITEVAVEDALIELEKNLEDTARVAEIHGLNIALKNFSLDSAARKQLLQSQDVRLEIKRYAIKLAKENYSLQGGNLWLSTQSQFLHADSVRLIPSEKNHRSAVAGRGRRPNLFEFFVPSLSIEGVNSTQAWFDRILNVNKIHIAAPDIKLTNYPEVNKKELNELARQNFYKLISKYLYSLEVKDLELEEGNFTFQDHNGAAENTFAANDMSVRIKNFRLDASSADSVAKPVLADDINIGMNIDGYSYMLPDSSHLITAHKIGVSTKDSTIYADSISIHPTKYVQKTPNAKTPNLYTGFIPRFELKGLNLLDWYVNNEVEVKGIRIISPRMLLNSFASGIPKKKEPKGTRTKRIYELIAPIFNSLTIDQLSVENAAYDMVHHEGGEVVKIRVPEVSLKLENFHLDSTTQMGPENLLFADNIDFQAKNINYRLGDSAHVIHVGGVGLLTKSSLIYVDSVKVTPRANIPNLQERVTGVYDVFLPRMEIKGVNAFEAYQDRALEVDSFVFSGPDIYLTNYPKVEKETIDSLAQSDLYELIRGYLTSFTVDGFRIDNGQFRYKDWKAPSEDVLWVEDMDLLIKNFQLDSVARSKTNNPFYADDIELELDIKSYSYMLPDSSYEVKVGKVGLSKKGSLIRLEDIQLIPHQIEGQAVVVSVPEVYLDGVRFPEIYFKRQVNLSALHFHNPSLRLLKRLGHARLDLPRPGSPLMPDLDLYGKIRSVVNFVSIAQVEFMQGNFMGYSPNYTPINFPDFSLVLENFRIDSFSTQRRDYNLYSDDFFINVNNYSLRTPDSMYVLKAKDFGVNSCDRVFYANDVTLEPRYGLYDFGKVNGHVTDRIEMELGSMRLNEIDMRRMIQSREFVAKNIWLEGLGLDVFRDKRLPDTIRVTKKLPQDILQEFPYLVDIDSLVLKKSMVTYREQAREGDHPGVITINDINAVLTNVTNDTSRTNHHLVAILNANARLMDKGHIRVRFKIPLANPNGKYTYTGIMGPMDLTFLNPMLQPTTYISVNNGNVQKVWFSVTADNDAARGRMRFYYEDLKVSIVNKKKGNFKNFESFVANSFVVRTNNPNRRFLRIGKMYFERNPNKSIFNYWIHTLFTGMASSIGAKGKKDKVRNFIPWKKKEKWKPEDSETKVIK